MDSALTYNQNQVMRKQQINISIPKPCHEDWNNMTPQERGRHCSSCDKLVTDFTTMSDNEVIDYIKLGKGSGCGRLNSRQLSGPLTALDESSSWFSPIGMAFSAALAFFSATAVASEKPPQFGGYRIILPKDTVPKDTLDTNLLRGRVSDAINGEGVPFAMVRIKDMEYITQTDSNGAFKLPIPENSRDQLEIVVSSIGYRSSEYCPANIDSHQSIKLIPMYASVVGERPEYSGHLTGTVAFVGDLVIVESRPKRFARKVGRVISWPYRRMRSAFRDW